jgi:phage host-nuclease inhibitor protein Gam
MYLCTISTEVERVFCTHERMSFIRLERIRGEIDSNSVLDVSDYVSKLLNKLAI